MMCRCPPPHPYRRTLANPTPESRSRLRSSPRCGAENERRATIQWNVFALQITSAGAIASLAIASISRSALLLVVPLSSYMLGGRYILHDHHIKVIQSYIRNSLSASLSDRLGWERWQEDATASSSSSLFTATGWNWTHPTRLALKESAHSHSSAPASLRCTTGAPTHRRGSRSPVSPSCRTRRPGHPVPPPILYSRSTPALTGCVHGSAAWSRQGAIRCKVGCSPRRASSVRTGSSGQD